VLDSIDRVVQKACSTHELTEQKRRESADNARWTDLAKALGSLKARREAGDVENEA
jgi:hypothetical protein